MSNLYIGQRGISINNLGVIAPAIDADAANLISAMIPIPDNTRQTLINDTIIDFKNSGIWSKIDEFWFYAAHSEQAGTLGWKRYVDSTLVNAPIFTVDRSFQPNGTTSYVNTNFSPALDGVFYQTNDASFGIYSRINGGLTGVDMGVNDGTSTNISTLAMRGPTDTTRFRVNQIQYTEVWPDVFDSTGLFVVRRTSSSAKQAIRNGVLIPTAFDPLQVSTNKATRTFYVGVASNNTIPASFISREYSFVFFGGAMSEVEQLSLFNIVESYLDSVGAGVIA